MMMGKKVNKRYKQNKKDKYRKVVV